MINDMLVVCMSVDNKVKKYAHKQEEDATAKALSGTVCVMDWMA
jgi:hypothetical protein